MPVYDGFFILFCYELIFIIFSLIANRRQKRAMVEGREWFYYHIWVSGLAT